MSLIVEAKNYFQLNLSYLTFSCPKSLSILASEWTELILLNIFMPKLHRDIAKRRFLDISVPSLVIIDLDFSSCFHTSGSPKSSSWKRHTHLRHSSCQTKWGGAELWCGHLGAVQTSRWVSQLSLGSPRPEQSQPCVPLCPATYPPTSLGYPWPSLPVIQAPAELVREGPDQNRHVSQSSTHTHTHIFWNTSTSNSWETG